MLNVCVEHICFTDETGRGQQNRVLKEEWLGSETADIEVTGRGVLLTDWVHQSQVGQIVPATADIQLTAPFFFSRYVWAHQLPRQLAALLLHSQRR